MTDFIDTGTQLDELPKGVVLYSCSGMIAARFDAERGVLFGSSETISWKLLPLPAVVIWHPDKPVTQWEPTPDPVIDTFEQLLDLPAGTVIRGLVGGVLEKGDDGHWYPTGSGRRLPIDRLNVLLPARMIWHPGMANV